MSRYRGQLMTRGLSRCVRGLCAAPPCPCVDAVEGGGGVGGGVGGALLPWVAEGRGGGWCAHGCPRGQSRWRKGTCVCRAAGARARGRERAVCVVFWSARVRKRHARVIAESDTIRMTLYNKMTSVRRWHPRTLWTIDIVTLRSCRARQHTGTARHHPSRPQSCAKSFFGLSPSPRSARLHAS